MPLGIALTIIFAVLKLCHVIAWSWLWVASPAIITAVWAAVALAVFAKLALRIARAGQRR